ncbi:unnamed protein product [Microthlaspi erraticum]|uniref:Uncharacterized protein n=1 Tax=Microthlaspi erraticum TaxID=1685480 RepID=A0A6D2ID85_9BRAS|nr:unnamed protein product [Microthlaspi erraticum]
MTEETPRYAVVTGANRGIGLEICRQLASKGIRVVLTSRDENRGFEAVETLKKEIGVSDQSLVFHQLVSVILLVSHLLPSVSGVITDVDALRAGTEKVGFNWEETITENYELAEECIKINYYGPKRMCEAFIPLLQLSDSPRIINVSSYMGQLKNLLNEWAKGILSDAENLTEERIDQAALNGYTRILAKEHPGFLVNSVCPGFVKTDMNFKTGVLSVEEGASSPVRLALLPHQEIPCGCFFDRKQLSEF